MPQIEVYDYRDLLPPGWRPASSYLGDLSETVGNYFKRRDESKANEAQSALRERRMGLEEQRLALAQAREERLAAPDVSEGAAMQGTLDQYTEKTQAEAQATVQSQLVEGLKTSGGALGPFGTLTGLAAGAPVQMAQIVGRMKANVDLARQMKPAAARQFLDRESAALKQEVLAHGYEAEFKALDGAAKDGEFETPEAVFRAASSGKRPDPSDIGMSKAKQFTNELQASLRARKPPGEIHKRLESIYNINRQLRERAQGWKKADQSAVELLSGLEKSFQAIEDPAVREQVVKKLAEARGEWSRTEPESFRMRSNPQESLAGLQKILFEFQAGGGAPKVGLTQTEIAARKAAPKAPYIGKRSPNAGRQIPDVDLLRNAVAAGAQDALRAGSPAERKKSISAMLNRLTHDLGVDVNDPSVRAIIREALSEAHGGGQ